MTRRWFLDPGLRRGNIRRIEQFLAGDGATARRVILGSSMSQVLGDQVLGPDSFSLAMAGSSALTGLEVLRRSDAHPQIVLIEANLLDFAEDEALLGHAFAPILAAVRQHSTIFRDENRPINFVVGIPAAGVRRLRNLVTWLRNDVPRSAAPNPAGVRGTDPVLFAKLMALETEHCNTPPDVEVLNAQCRKVREVVQILEKRGSICVFQEMPIEPSLVISKRCTTLREIAHRYFPDTEYRWIPPDRAGAYETKDGVHLTQDSARHRRQYLIEQIDRILAHEPGGGGVAPREL